MVKKSFALLAVAVGLYALFYLTDMDDKLLLHQVNNQTAHSGQMGAGVELGRYLLAGAPQPLAGINDNLSGLTYCPASNTLFAITNNPCRMYEIGTDGALLRTIAMPGFEDTEGVVYVRDNFFAVIEERRHVLHLLEIDGNTTVVNRNQVHKSLTIDIKGADNSGFEGLAYDPHDKVFFIAIEKDELQVIKVTGWPAGAALQIHTDTALLGSDLNMDDFSGLHFDVNSGNLVFLSDESKRLTAVTQQGKHRSSMVLERGFSGLHDDIPQPEGVTMDSDGTLYVVSEPNIFYCFKPMLDDSQLR